MSKKITVGPASHIVESKNRKLYGGRSSGKVVMNGGFSGCINVGYTNIDEEKWRTAFPNSFRPSWDKAENNK